MVITKKTVGSLDPKKHHLAIVQWSLTEEWIFDHTRATELALLKTFAIPSIAKILVDSAEFLNRPLKRYEDTDIILSTILELGYDSPKGRKMLQRMNAIHKKYPITNEQYLYVLASFVLEPLRWNETYGYRPLSESEKLSAYYYWQVVGTKMGIQDIPSSLVELSDFYEAYEEKNMIFSPENTVLLHKVLPILKKELQWPLGLLLPKLLPLMLPARMCEAFKITMAAPWQRKTIEKLLRLRSLLAHILPNRKFLRHRRVFKSYPQGFTSEDIGPR